MTHVDFAMASLLNGMCQGMVVGAVVWLALKLLPRLNPATRFAILGLALFAVAALSMRPFSGRMVAADTQAASTAFTPVEIRPQSKNPTSAVSQFASIPQSRSEQWLGRTSEFMRPWQTVSTNPSPVKTVVAQPSLHSDGEFRAVMSEIARPDGSS